MHRAQLIERVLISKKYRLYGKNDNTKIDYIHTRINTILHADVLHIGYNTIQLCGKRKMGGSVSGLIDNTAV